MKNISDRREHMVLHNTIIFIDQLQSIEYHDDGDLVVTLIDGREIYFVSPIGKLIWDKLMAD
jgi:hypothetical protein